MKVTGILVLCLGVCSAKSYIELLDEFESFIVKYGKTYPSMEEKAKRFEIFKANAELIDNSNGKQRMNNFGDLTAEEFRRLYLGSRKPHAILPPHRHVLRRSEKPLPKEVDWRKKQVMTPIKNQGLCGNCWAMSATATFESLAYINSNASGPVKVLSEAQMTACTPNPLNCGGDGACGGATEGLAYSYTQLFGLAAKEEYSGSMDEPCKYDKLVKPAAINNGYNILPRNEMEPLMRFVAEQGPISVGVDAGGFLQFHSGEDLIDCSFDESININHGVVLVGYGSDHRGDYWIIRNSWGASWGDNGYCYMRRRAEAKCGADLNPLMGSGCDAQGNVSVAVCGTCGILYETVYPTQALYV